MPAISRRQTQKMSFFDLPVEIRYEIYSMILRVDREVIDFDPRNHREISRRLKLFLVSKKFHEDASHYFYGENKFRLFPTHGSFFSNRQMPLIRCLSPMYRASITRLELRFGPGWTKPPTRSWRVNKQLGLQDLNSLKRLDVHIEIDPSSSIFKGFRKSGSYYTEFASALLNKTVAALPSLEEVRFDGYSFATVDDPLLARLVTESTNAGMKISFGGVWSRTLMTEDTRPNPKGVDYTTSGIAMLSMQPEHLVRRRVEEELDN